MWLSSHAQPGSTIRRIFRWGNYQSHLLDIQYPIHCRRSTVSFNRLKTREAHGWQSLSCNWETNFKQSMQYVYTYMASFAMCTWFLSVKRQHCGIATSNLAMRAPLRAQACAYCAPSKTTRSQEVICWAGADRTTWPRPTLRDIKKEGH